MIKNWLKHLAIFLGVFFLDNSFFPMLLKFAGISANLSLIYIMLFGIYFGSVKGAGAGLFLGLISDILFSNPVGISALILFAAGAAGGLLINLKGKIIYLPVAAFCFTVVFLFFRYLINSFFFSETIFTNYLKFRYLCMIFLNSILVIPMNLIFDRLFGERDLSFEK